MAIEAAIQAALYGHLKGLVLPTALPIAAEGKNFNAQGKAYLRPIFLPAETVEFGTETDGDNIYAGLFQVDVFWPTNTGLGDPLTVASALSVRFARGTKIAAPGFTVRIDKPPSFLPVLQEPAWLQIPVRVRWAAYVANPITA